MLSVGGDRIDRGGRDVEGGGWGTPDSGGVASDSVTSWSFPVSSIEGVPADRACCINVTRGGVGIVSGCTTAELSASADTNRCVAASSADTAAITLSTASRCRTDAGGRRSPRSECSGESVSASSVPRKSLADSTANSERRAIGDTGRCSAQGDLCAGESALGGGGATRPGRASAVTGECRAEATEFILAALRERPRRLVMKSSSSCSRSELRVGRGTPRGAGGCVGERGRSRRSETSTCTSGNAIR